ncbi:tRNA(Ile)(2)-agmatinylcytidine synthase [Methanosalsum natronophilum]|uniref:tRNA(Ile)(2)-agmatinylcytidine synthase n=1 Tax=Methanosalsum natronophilum TaxID=768733 RepID=UPI0021698308|nr:tRNA(Ile)(2)-agmatinylcytidine synthase [Methanosalsum natronophilum]MCS3924346.1 tRNA(Ile2)-agmatinylcytidine synthase [Methanosalsum natronophilum]
MIIGIDDTDSREGMCTTYLCTTLADELIEFGEVSKDLLLIRLNPTIPYKTRGNAAVALQINTEVPQDVIKHVSKRVFQLSRLSDENTNPGIVFVPDNISKNAQSQLVAFFREATRSVIEINSAISMINRMSLEYKGFKNGRGLIGALAACGAVFDDKMDYTYEYIAYRKREAWGNLRYVDEKTIFMAHKKTYPKTWDNVDTTAKKAVCIPKSGDPVLYGIRGSCIESIFQFISMLKSESVENSALFRTNQGTDMHILAVDTIKKIVNMKSYKVRCIVDSIPKTLHGGHIILRVCDDYGYKLDCAAYEPTKQFRHIIKKLLPGDIVVLFGSVMGSTLNIEKIHIKTLTKYYEIINPICPSCKKRMESAGKNKGYRCKKCKKNSSLKQAIELKRDISPGFYEVPPGARRHLAKPLIRIMQQGRHSNIFPST